MARGMTRVVMLTKMVRRVFGGYAAFSTCA